MTVPNTTNKINFIPTRDQEILVSNKYGTTQLIFFIDSSNRKVYFENSMSKFNDEPFTLDCVDVAAGEDYELCLVEIGNWDIKDIPEGDEYDLESPTGRILFTMLTDYEKKNELLANKSEIVGISASLENMANEANKNIPNPNIMLQEEQADRARKIVEDFFNVKNIHPMQIPSIKDLHDKNIFAISISRYYDLIKKILNELDNLYTRLSNDDPSKYEYLINRTIYLDLVDLLGESLGEISYIFKTIVSNDIDPLKKLYTSKLIDDNVAEKYQKYLNNKFENYDSENVLSDIDEVIDI